MYTPAFVGEPGVLRVNRQKPENSVYNFRALFTSGNT